MNDKPCAIIPDFHRDSILLLIGVYKRLKPTLEGELQNIGGLYRWRDHNPPYEGPILLAALYRSVRNW